jgi:hypothetical protein
MHDLAVERVREPPRAIADPGLSRNIVGAGAAGEIVAKGRAVEIEFKPNTPDQAQGVQSAIESMRFIQNVDATTWSKKMTSVLPELGHALANSYQRIHHSRANDTAMNGLKSGDTGGWGFVQKR